MIAHLNELEILRAKIDRKTQVDIMFMLLLEFFKNFCLNYTMSKRSYSLAELLKELQVAEGIVGQKKSMHVMEKCSSTKNRKKKKNVLKQNAQSKKKPKVSEGKPKDKCFTCDQKGH